MITIGRIYKEKHENDYYLCSHITDDSRSVDEVIWFKTTLEWGEYIYDECADPFVLLVVLPAIKYRQDIVVDGDMSQTLYYHLNTALMHMFACIHDAEYDGSNLHIKLIVKGDLIDVKTDSIAVGCGCSLGVDSLSSIIRHTSADCPPPI